VEPTTTTEAPQRAGNGDSCLDLSPIYTAYTDEDDEDGNPIYAFCSFDFFTAEYDAYFGQSSIEVSTLTAELIKQCLQHLPGEDVYPELPACGITTFSEPLNDNFFLKRPKVHLDFIGTGLLP
jgi:hypothetical protein